MLRSVLASALAVLLACSASADPIGYESFGGYVTYEATIGGLEGRIVPNFKDGNPVGGQTPPDTATSGIYNWIAGNPWGGHRAVEGDLTYPGHPVSGGKKFAEVSGGLDVSALMDVTGVPNAGGGVFSDLENASGVIGKDGTSLYVSFLYQLRGTSTTGPDQNFLQFREGGTSRFYFGQTWQNPQIRAQDFNLAPLDTDAHLVVMKIDYQDGDDLVSLFFDPVATLPEESQTLTNTYTRAMEFDRIFFKGQGNHFNFDELRFGTDWVSVVPGSEGAVIPEPSTFLLAGLALAALGACAARQRARRAG